MKCRQGHTWPVKQCRGCADVFPRAPSAAPSQILARSRAPAHAPSQAAPSRAPSRAGLPPTVVHHRPDAGSGETRFELQHGQNFRYQTRGYTRPFADGGYMYERETHISTTTQTTSRQHPPVRCQSVAPSQAASRQAYTTQIPRQLPSIEPPPRSQTVAPSQAGLRHGQAPRPLAVLSPPRLHGTAPSHAPSQTHRPEGRHRNVAFAALSPPQPPSSRHYPPAARHNQPRLPPQEFVTGEVTASPRQREWLPETTEYSISVSSWRDGVAKAIENERESHWARRSNRHG